MNDAEVEARIKALANILYALYVNGPFRQDELDYEQEIAIRALKMDPNYLSESDKNAIANVARRNW